MMEVFDSTPESNITYVHYTHATFQVLDYIVFAGFLCVSGAVGIFFSMRGHKNTGDYFFGGRQMGAIPVGISNGVSFLSALALVGFPSEYYINGSDIWFEPFMGAMAYFLGGVLVVIVIYPLKMNSLSEYFVKRFKSKLLTYVANVMVLLCIFEYMGSSMLGSIVALNSATGGQVGVITGLCIAGAVGIFYTSIGGLKAVVWTDVIQCGFMLAGIIAVAIHAVADTTGGFSRIVEMNEKYQRIHPVSWSTDPTVRHTIWGMTIGKFAYLVMWPIQPAGVQRLCSTKSRKDSLIVAGIAGFLYLLFASLPILAGFNIFGYYLNRGCDIHEAGWVQKNEISLYYVRERLNYPGFQGFFIAALFSGSLSSFSSGLSAASAIIWEDMIKPLLPRPPSDLKATFISKMLVVIFGTLSMAWCYTLYSIGGLILQVTQSFDASMYGAYFGLFAFAIFFRYGNYKGALVGLMGSFGFTLWLGLGSLLKGQTMDSNWPSDTSKCYVNPNFTTIATTLAPTSPGPTSPPVSKGFADFLLSISYAWMPLICVCVSLFLSLLVSGCTAPMKKNYLKPEHLFPLCRPGFFRRETLQNCCEGFEDSESENEETKPLPTDSSESSVSSLMKSHV